MVTFLPSDVRGLFDHSDLCGSEREAWAGLIIEFLRKKKENSWATFTLREMTAFIRHIATVEYEDVALEDTMENTGWWWNWSWSDLWSGLRNLLRDMMYARAGMRSPIPVVAPQPEPEAVRVEEETLHPAYKAMAELMVDGPKRDDMIRALLSLIHDGYLIREEVGDDAVFTVTEKFTGFYAQYVVSPQAEVAAE